MTEDERNLKRYDDVLATYDLDALADLVMAFGDNIDGSVRGYEDTKLNAKRMSHRIRTFDRDAIDFKGITRRWGIRGQVLLLDFYKEKGIE